MKTLIQLNIGICLLSGLVPAAPRSMSTSLAVSAMPSGCVRAKIAVNRYFFQCKNLFFETNLGTYRRSTLEILTNHAVDLQQIGLSLDGKRELAAEA